MTTAARVAAFIASTREHAKFVSVSHSAEWIDAAAGLGAGFHIASLYDEFIDANMIVGKGWRAMVQNTYLASFAYNLFLCCLHHRRHGAAGVAYPDVTLAHNFKKFFAEQLYRASDRVPARALLLETLLYEQQCMVPIFAAKAREPDLAAGADWGSGLMSLAINMHEFGHYMLVTRPEEWVEVAGAEDGLPGAMFEQILAEHGPELADEFRCDAWAVLAALRQCSAHAGETHALRGFVFAFAAYAAMYSARDTALATAALWTAVPETPIDFRDIAPMPHVEHETAWAIDRAFFQRARWVQDLCAAMASRRGVALFGDDGRFSLPATVIEDMQRFVGRVFDCADDNARAMSNLAAQALQGHSVGMEYLYLRSKVFTTRRPGGVRL